jgi:hypothetical protein
MKNSVSGIARKAQGSMPIRRALTRSRCSLFFSSAAKDPCLFSLLLSDGRTLDFEAASPALRNEWTDRLKALLANTAQFVQYHFEVAQYKVHELVKKEKERLSPSNIKKLVDKEKVRGTAAPGARAAFVSTSSN